MRKALAAILAVSLILLTGCWDKTEIEDTIYVASIGVDAADEGYMWSFRLVEPEKLVLGMLSTVPGKTGELASGVIAVRAHSLEQAVQLMQPGLSRIISLNHVRWIAFGQELARKGVAPVLSQFLRHNEIRRNANIYVFRSQALDGFLYNRPLADTNSIKFFDGMRLVQKRMHLAPPMQLHHFYSRLMSPGVDPITGAIGVNKSALHAPDGDLPPGQSTYRPGETPREGGNRVEFMGTAIFQGDRLVGLLSVNETESLLSMRGELGKVYASVPDPYDESLHLTLRFHQENKPQFRARFVGRRPTVSVKMQFEAELLSNPGTTDYSAPVHRRVLERHIEKFIKEQSHIPMFARVYTEWGADPVGFGQLFRAQFPTLDAWLAYRWPDHVKELAATFEVTVFVRRFGMMLGNPQFLRSKE